MIQIVDIKTFYEHIAQFEYVPHTQTQAWMQAIQSLGTWKLVPLIGDGIACIAIERHFLGIKWLSIEDECLLTHEIKNANRTNFYAAIREMGYDIIEVNNRQSYQAEYEIALRQAGFLRPIGSFSCQLTNIISLTQPLSFNENWRRNLKKAEANELLLRYAATPTESEIDIFMNLYSEMAHRKQISIPFTKDFIRILLRSNNFRLYFVSYHNNMEAAIIVHTCGTHAGLLYAANSAQANDLAAGAFMYREVMLHLAEEGFLSFDMEKLVASTHSTNAVFLFKQGVRGCLTSLNGEWTYYQKTWLGMALFFLKKYYWKIRQA